VRMEWEDFPASYFQEMKDVYGASASGAITQGVGTVLASQNRKPSKLVQRAHALAYRRRRKRKKEKR
jgi:hypothetical protein